MRRFWLLFLLTLGTLAGASNTVNVSFNVTDMGATPGATVQARFIFVNCGSNSPMVGAGNIAYPTALLSADGSGNITGTVYGTDVVQCGGAATGYYQLTYIINGVPSSKSNYYYIRTGAGTFNPALAPLCQLGSGQQFCVLYATPTAVVQAGPAGPGGIQSANAPLVYSAGNQQLSVPAATGSVDGYLSHNDWTTFNNKGSASYPGVGIALSTGTGWNTSMTFDTDPWLTSASNTRIASQAANHAFTEALAAATSPRDYGITGVAGVDQSTQWQTMVNDLGASGTLQVVQGIAGDEYKFHDVSVPNNVQIKGCGKASGFLWETSILPSCNYDVEQGIGFLYVDNDAHSNYGKGYAKISDVSFINRGTANCVTFVTDINTALALEHVSALNTNPSKQNTNSCDIMAQFGGYTNVAGRVATSYFTGYGTYGFDLWCAEGCTGIRYGTNANVIPIYNFQTTQLAGNTTGGFIELDGFTGLSNDYGNMFYGVNCEMENAEYCINFKDTATGNGVFGVNCSDGTSVGSGGYSVACVNAESTSGHNFGFLGSYQVGVYVGLRDQTSPLSNKFIDPESPTNSLPGGWKTTTQGAGSNDTFLATDAYADGAVSRAVCTAYSALTDGAAVAWNTNSHFCSDASLLFTVHTGSRTLNVSNLVAGGHYRLRLTQDATGGVGLTLGSGCTWKVAGGGSGSVTLTNSANAIDVLVFDYDGTNCQTTLSTNLN